MTKYQSSGTRQSGSSSSMFVSLTEASWAPLQLTASQSPPPTETSPATSPSRRCRRTRQSPPSPAQSGARLRPVLELAGGQVEADGLGGAGIQAHAAEGFEFAHGAGGGAGFLADVELHHLVGLAGAGVAELDADLEGLAGLRLGCGASGPGSQAAVAEPEAEGVERRVGPRSSSARSSRG